ncbi:hypothetical protein Leryth_004013 [Lithospermum erythrorhizon]|nr:hypothetical protein Leryth_004013 [Lithospermum erythrorhizon]
MGSSETASRAVDCSIGSIVWVRRRNGSWWPGKILGSDEISTAHLTSPRSGTPVKLLGREDASVDWYNLEKSKRVKTFRCGEFDQCISRAEASRGLPPKKREKYAHREDAILHALELEKQMLKKKYGEQNGSSAAGGTNLVVASNYLENDGAKPFHCKSNQDSGIHGSSVVMDINGHDFDTDRVQETYPMSGDGDSSSALNNFRNLKDFGHANSVEHAYLPSEALNDSTAPTSINTVHDSPNGSTRMIDVKSNSLFKKQDKQLSLVVVPQKSSQISQCEPNMDASTSLSRREQEGVIHHPKRSRYAYMIADSGVSPTDNRNRSQMVTPTNMLTPGNHGNLCEESTSDSSENTETDSSGSQTTESDLDDVLSDDDASIGLEPKYPGSIGTGSYADHGSVSSEDYDVTLNHGVSNFYYDKPASANEGASRWNLRRKRNNDSIMKRSLDPADKKPFGGSYKEYFNDYNNFKKSSKTQTPPGYRSRGVDSAKHDLHNWEKLGGNQTAGKGYLEDFDELFGPAYTGRRQLDGRPVLIDVDLEVKAGYQRPHVPFISLTSKMNGHAIVGHPVQIEVLENGSSDNLFAAIDDFYPEVSNYSTALGPVWRTGRRTANSRVPRSQPRSYPASHLDGDKSPVNIHVGVYHDGKVSFGKPKIGALDQSASMMKNTIANSLLDKTHSRKQPKKNGLSCNKKVRTLSSLTSEQNPSSSNLKPGANMHLGIALIKPDSVLKAVPCIPVKLVFSRLHEELFGRHQ